MKHFFPFLILLSLMSTGLNAQTEKDWMYHQCKPGEKNYAPGHRLAQRRKTTGYEFDFTIKAQDWYDPKILGSESKDWLKAAGVSYFCFLRPATWAKNHLSALIGFRMKAGQRFEVCAYVNDIAGGHRFDGVINAAVGETVRVVYRLENNKARYTLQYLGKTTEVTFDKFETAGRQVSVGPWHGGSSPAPVRTGVWGVFRTR